MTSTDTARADVPDEQAEAGAFRRKDSRFRDWVRADGSTDYLPAAGRYHLYVAASCPWAHRTMIYRHLKGLEGAISMTIVDPERDERGWAVTDGPGTTPDPVNHFTFLREGYTITDPAYDGRVTVPVLWDRERGRIVNNESADIIRMLEPRVRRVRASTRSALLPRRSCAPRSTRSTSCVYENVNNGVYRAGFATTQAAYEGAFGKLFDALDGLEARLATQPLPGRRPRSPRPTGGSSRRSCASTRSTSATSSATCGGSSTTRTCPATCASSTSTPASPRRSTSTTSSGTTTARTRTINPKCIVPVGPALDFTSPHGREHLS